MYLPENRIKKILLALIPLAFGFFSSCSQQGHISAYPNLTSLEQRKPGFRWLEPVKRRHDTSGNTAGSVIAWKSQGRDSIESFPICMNSLPDFPGTGLLKFTPARRPVILQRGIVKKTTSDPHKVTGRNAATEYDVSQALNRLNPSVQVDQLPPAAKDDPLSRKEKRNSTFALISVFAALAFIPFTAIQATAFLALPLSAIAIIFGILGLRSPRRYLALTGLILGGLEFVMLILLSVVFMIIFSNFLKVWFSF